MKPSFRRRRLAWILLILVFAGYELFLIARDPEIAMLLPHTDAGWIRLDEPFRPTVRPSETTSTFFRTRFELEALPAHAPLDVCAFRSAGVIVNGQRIAEPRDVERWKEWITVELAPGLRTGANELVIAVSNRNAHPALLAHATEIGIGTGAADAPWEASRDGELWSRAVRADEPVRLPIWDALPGALSGSASAWPWLAAVFFLSFGAVLARDRGHFRIPVVTPSRLRWFLLAAWVVLAVNDCWKLPLALGFDYPGHLEYIRYVAEHWRIPSPDAGWETFQAPLYYFLAAALVRILEAVSLEPVEYGLRLFSLACGALQIEIAWRTMRAAFRDRPDLQCIGLWVAGLLPMNLYIAQYPGNEPLSGAATGLVVLLCLKAIASEDEVFSLRRAAGLGLALGIALLTKGSAVLLLPWIGLAYVTSSLLRHRPRAAAAVVTLTIAALVGGWFYARSWILTGRPVLGGWEDNAVATAWWQDPSYRVPQEFARFGQALEQPIFAPVAGVWDGLYASLWSDAHVSGVIAYPPWNYPFLFACVWLALPVTMLMLLGAVVPLDARAARARSFALIGIALYLAAFLHAHLALPSYSVTKATYLLGLTPCLGLLAAAGCAPFLRSPWSRALVTGLLACHGFAAYATYFVL